MYVASSGLMKQWDGKGREMICIVAYLQMLGKDKKERE